MEFQKVLDKIESEYKNNLYKGVEEAKKAKSNAILEAIFANDPEGILDKPLTKAEQIYCRKYLSN